MERVHGGTSSDMLLGRKAESHAKQCGARFGGPRRKARKNSTAGCKCEEVVVAELGV